MILALALFLSLQARAADTPLIVQGISQRISSLDPYTLTGIEQFQATGNVIEPLARADAFSKELLPCLAESWKVEGTIVHLSLRKNAVFHNGQPFTADDVKFTFDSYYDPKFKAEIWQGMFRNVKEVKVIDPHKIDIVMKESDLEMFRNIMTTMRILPRSSYGSSDKRWRDSNLIGTGPFKLAKFDPAKNLDLEPNDKWWGEPKPAFRLRIKPVSDFHLAELMYQKKEIDFYEVPADESSAFKSPSVTPVQSATGNELSIGLNLRKPLFQLAATRKALVHLWNRQALNEKVFDGKWEIAVDPFSPLMEYYPKGGKPLKYDLKTAERILKSQGWKDSNKDSILDKDGEKFEFTLLVHDSASEKWATLYQADAAKVGIKVNLQRIDEDVQWWKILKEGKFDAVASSGLVSDQVHFSTWHSKGEYNFYGVNFPKIDKQIEVFLKTGWDPAKFKQAQRELIANLRETHSQLPGLFSRHALFILSPRIQIDEKFPTQAWRWRSKL